MVFRNPEVARLAKGEQVFGLFFFKEKAHRSAIESIRIGGRTPTDVSDWAHVRDHLDWRDRMLTAHRRWQALAVEIGAPQENLTSARALSELLKLLNAVTVDAPAAFGALQESLPRIAYGTDQPASLWSSAQRLALARDLVHSALGAARLSAPKEEIKRVNGLFTDASGRLGTLAREFLRDAVGRGRIESLRVERAWDAVRTSLDDLAQHEPHFKAVLALSKRVEAAGAPDWAKRILQEEAQEHSTWCCAAFVSTAGWLTIERRCSTPV